ncbi:hypothetical protein Aperf_G00000061337 [Anoplocephala perfoliata]
MPDMNLDNLNPPGGRKNDSSSNWSAMRRLSGQLTVATLAAMQKADASFPGKPLLDVPILACPNCHKPDHLCYSDSFNDFKSSSKWHPGLQRCGRSKSVAFSGLDCRRKYCAAYFYQSPFKDYVWSRPSMRSSRIPIWQQCDPFHSRTPSMTPGDIDTDEITALSGLYPGVKSVERSNFKKTKRRSSSLTELPAMSSQHTQTIFSSITPVNESISAGNKMRSRLKSGSLYTKQSSGLRFQLPAALQKSKSLRKCGIDFGLRKTLSVTNVIVRMPIESAASSSKKNLASGNSTGDPTKDQLMINVAVAPSLVKSTQDIASCVQSNKSNRGDQVTIIYNELYNASDTGSLRSLPTDHTLDSIPRDGDDLKAEIVKNRRVTTTQDDSGSERHFERIGGSTGEGDTCRDDEVQKTSGKRDVQLQTMEDFEKEIKNSFNIPRILNEEDQRKEPAEDVDLDVAGGMEDSSKQRSKEYWKEQFMMFFQPSDNKLAKKLFGTKVALNKERTRQRKQGKWIIHPASNFR